MIERDQWARMPSRGDLLSKVFENGSQSHAQPDPRVVRLQNLQEEKQVLDELAHFFDFSDDMMTDEEFP